MADRFGDHARAYPCGGDRTKRHNRSHAVLAAKASGAGLSPEVEKPGLMPASPSDSAAARRAARPWCSAGRLQMCGCPARACTAQPPLTWPSPAGSGVAQLPRLRLMGHALAHPTRTGSGPTSKQHNSTRHRACNSGGMRRRMGPCCGTDMAHPGRSHCWQERRSTRSCCGTSVPGPECCLAVRKRASSPPMASSHRGCSHSAGPLVPHLPVAIAEQSHFGRCAFSGQRPHPSAAWSGLPPVTLGARGSFFLACCCSVSSAVLLWVVRGLRVSGFVSVRSLLVWLRQQEIQAWASCLLGARFVPRRGFCLSPCTSYCHYMGSGQTSLPYIGYQN